MAPNWNRSLEILDNISERARKRYARNSSGCHHNSNEQIVDIRVILDKHPEESSEYHKWLSDNEPVSESLSSRTGYSGHEIMPPGGFFSWHDCDMNDQDSLDAEQSIQYDPRFDDAPESIRANNAQWKQIPRTVTQNNRAKKLGYVGDLTVEQWNAVKKAFGGKCAYCGSVCRAYMDHFIPVSRGGGTTLGNVVTACGSCNSKKGRKKPIEFVLGIDNGDGVMRRIKSVTRKLCVDFCKPIPGWAK